MILIFTCEHAVNTIPSDFQPYFLGSEKLLESHRGLDIGAVELADYLSQFFKAVLFKAKASRLLIDCNRSIGHPHCFSEKTKSLTKEEKKVLIENYYLHYRQPIEAVIAQQIAANIPVLHLSIHSFTPELNGIKRTADLGLLYDSRRKKERLLAQAWQKKVKNDKKDIIIRLNYPYQGKSDGFTSALRKKYPESLYLGIEVEMNQNIFANKALFAEVKKVLAISLHGLLPEQ